MSSHNVAYRKKILVLFDQDLFLLLIKAFFEAYNDVKYVLLQFFGKQTIRVPKIFKITKKMDKPKSKSSKKPKNMIAIPI